MLRFLSLSLLAATAAAAGCIDNEGKVKEMRWTGLKHVL